MSQTLAMQSTAVTPDNPLRVIVSGGGVGGLFLAKALQNQGMKVTVLEKTGKFERFGGPIQLASNALATIKGIDESLFEKLMKKFTFTGTRRRDTAWGGGEVTGKVFRPGSGKGSRMGAERTRHTGVQAHPPQAGCAGVSPSGQCTLPR